MKDVNDFLVDGVYQIPEEYLTKGIIKNIQQMIDNKEKQQVNKVISVCEKPYNKITKDFKGSDVVTLDEVYNKMLGYGSSCGNQFYKDFSRNILNKGVITQKQARLLAKLYLETKNGNKPTSDQVYEMDGIYDQI